MLDERRVQVRMDVNLEGTGIDPGPLQRYIQEQIYSLPGTNEHREVFTVLLTGSRATGTHGPRSDVDIDVVCPQAVYELVLSASQATGIIKAPGSFFRVLEGDDWGRYFGKERGRPHFSVTPLEQVEQHIRAYEDVPLWIWTNAHVLQDPNDQFRRTIEKFHGYPQEVLLREIRYRWMMAGYWEVECYPHHHGPDYEFLPGAAALLNAVNELLRLFFLVEGRPFPNTKRLMVHAEHTNLGKQFCGMLREIVSLVIAAERGESSTWDRLDRASEMLSGETRAAEELEDGCMRAMIEAGVDPQWAKADFRNIEELRSGRLGPLP
jgi:hypothetical protein